MARGRWFVVIEGIDGVGKTAVTNYLATHYGYRAYQTPPRWLRPIRRFADRSHSIILRMAFYMIANCVVSLTILCRGRSAKVVCDRYVASTVAYHYTSYPSAILEKTVRLFMLVPSITILLSATEEVRRNRIDQQLSLTKSYSQSKWDNPSQAFLSRVEANLRSRCNIEIDTTLMDIRSVSKVVHSIATDYYGG